VPDFDGNQILIEADCVIKYWLKK